MTGTGLGKDKEDIVHPQSYQVLQLEECQLLAVCPWARLTTPGADRGWADLGSGGPGGTQATQFQLGKGCHLLYMDILFPTKPAKGSPG